jgi:oxygen-independent coproporphyrinogen-3 oxidase
LFTRIYLHIPFCRKKCPYCAFFSQEPANGDLERHVRLLQQEMTLRSQALSAAAGIDSIYFGGGTPSLLEPRQIEQLLANAAKLFKLKPSVEITLEANPGTVAKPRLTDFRRAGINRLSLGVQSFDDRMLTTLGRIHTSRQAFLAFEAARQAGFDNIAIDLMHSLPAQTPEMWLSELEQAVKLAPEHISVYGLTIEEETPFAGRYPQSSPHLPDQDLSADMSEAAEDLLTTGGYEHYEIANYALPGRRSDHNCGYWQRDGYLGLGAGAHSFFRDTSHGIRSSNICDLEAYSTALQNGSLACENPTHLTYDDAVAEFMFLGLRMTDGVSFRTFRQEFGIELRDIFGQQLDDLASMDLLHEDVSGVRLTRRGMLLSNQVFQKFLP